MPQRPGPKTRRSREKIYTVVETAALVGLREAARLTRTPLTTVFRWKKLEKEGALEAFIEEKCPVSSEDLSLIRQQNKAVFVEKALDLTLKILTAMENKIPEANFKDLAVSFGVLIDKIMLVTGNPTSRTETVRSVNREDLLQAVREVGEKAKVLPLQRGK